MLAYMNAYMIDGETPPFMKSQCPAWKPKKFRLGRRDGQPAVGRPVISVYSDDFELNLAGGSAYFGQLTNFFAQ